jgi:Zn-dependent protease with chaperone function
VAGAAWASTPVSPEPRQLQSILKRAEQLQEVQISDEQEQKLGETVSERVRVRYGVVQDAGVHHYVSLVGTVLAQASTRPNLPWRFIVLDTDGVNAFAAPGGYIHITRGALGLVTNEAELAGVLAHEIIHVTQRHTIKAIQKGKLVQLTAQEADIRRSEVFSKLVDASTEIVLAGFGRSEELESDRNGLRLASKVGYAPGGLSAFLTRLIERNKNATRKQGLFASHPEMKERLDRIARQIADERLTADATLEARYTRFISYTAKPQAEIVAIAEGTSGLTAGGKEKDEEKGKAGEEKKDEPKKKKGGFGLSNLLAPGGGEKKSAEVTASGASRGVDTERGATGGPASTIVAVALTAADIDAFKKEGHLR